MRQLKKWLGSKADIDAQTDPSTVFVNITFPAFCEKVTKYGYCYKSFRAIQRNFRKLIRKRNVKEYLHFDLQFLRKIVSSKEGKQFGKVSGLDVILFYEHIQYCMQSNFTIIIHIIKRFI